MSNSFEPDIERRLKVAELFARFGRPLAALQRVEELYRQFPDKPCVHYACAALVEEFLGRGIDAYHHYETALNMVLNSSDRSLCEPCLMHLSMLSLNALLFRKWSKEISNTGAVLTEVPMIQQDITYLESGIPYWIILQNRVIQIQGSDLNGEKAAMLEIALSQENIPIGHEIEMRRKRAQELRALDVRAYRQYQNVAFFPEQRIVLQEAVKEIDAALAIDAHDAVLWNLKSAWKNLLCEWESAMETADRAHSLRPRAYPKPLINKACALKNLGRFKEAENVLKEAILEAEACGATQDIKLADRNLADLARPFPSPDVMAEIEWFQSFLFPGVIHGLGIDILNDTNKNIAPVVANLARIVETTGKSPMKLVPVMEEFLSDFTPEEAWAIIMFLPEWQLHSVPCLYTVHFIAANATGLLKSDAIRVMLYWILSARDMEEIRERYRQTVIETAVAGNPILPSIWSEARQELRLILPVLEEFVEDQPPITQDDAERASRLIDRIYR